MPGMLEMDSKSKLLCMSFNNLLLNTWLGI